MRSCDRRRPGSSATARAGRTGRPFRGIAPGTRRRDRRHNSTNAREAGVIRSIPDPISPTSATRPVGETERREAEVSLSPVSTNSARLRSLPGVVEHPPGLRTSSAERSLRLYCPPLPWHMIPSHQALATSWSFRPATGGAAWPGSSRTPCAGPAARLRSGGRDHADANRRRDHLDVDGLVGERAEHLGGDPGWSSSPPTRLILAMSASWFTQFADLSATCTDDRLGSGRRPSAS